MLVADEYVGAVMSDLSGRRGRVVGHRAGGHRAHPGPRRGPELEITRYAVDLRSMSHGTGTFTRAYARHEAMPSHLATKVTDGGRALALAYPWRVSIAAPRTDAVTSAVGRVGVAGRGAVCSHRRRAGDAGSGIVLGDDWTFPFGPLRMYSTGFPAERSVSYERLEALTSDGLWHRTALSPTNIGMNRAEVEGRTPRSPLIPSLLGTSPSRTSRLHPELRLDRRPALEGAGATCGTAYRRTRPRTSSPTWTAP